MVQFPYVIAPEEIRAKDTVEVTHIPTDTVRRGFVVGVDFLSIHLYFETGAGSATINDPDYEWRLLNRQDEKILAGAIIGGTQLLALPPATVVRRYGPGTIGLARWVVMADGKENEGGKYLMSPTSPSRTHRSVSNDLKYVVEFIPTQHGTESLN